MKRTIKLMAGGLLLLVVLLGTGPLHAFAADESALLLGDWAITSQYQITVEAPDAGITSRVSGFDPSIDLVGWLPPGSLGLPGEPVTWVITVTNASASSGVDVLVTDVLRDELLIDTVVTARGNAAISGQTVMVSIPVIAPGESVEMRINTTVLRGPASGVLVNQALLAATGPGGAIAKSAVAEVFVPTGLPATGYAPIDLPGEGEPSVAVVGLAAFGTVALTALFVWYRGRR